MHVDVVLRTRQLLSAQDLIGGGEEVDLGAVDFGEEGLEELEEDVLQDELREGPAFEDDEAFALLGGKCTELEDLHANNPNTHPHIDSRTHIHSSPLYQPVKHTYHMVRCFEGGCH